VLVVLQRHIGQAAASRPRTWRRLAGVNEREVRHQVSALREDGIAVCGHPKTGYFIAATAGELETTVEYLKTARCTAFGSSRE
jgi:biotin operon repressor